MLAPAVSLIGTCLSFGQVVINEIHYDPDIKTERAEFIELYNTGAQMVDLNGWSLTGGIGYPFTNGAAIPAGGYLVVAQDPSTILAKYGATALGPWSGSLANEGDRVVLRDAAGQVVNEVDYQSGFPWPTVGDPPGYSIELVNPAFDNSLGGNWRISVAPGLSPTQNPEVLLPAGSTWRYFKGWSEASTPVSAWRTSTFDDSTWLVGQTPLGYGEPNVPIATAVDDMRSNYTTVFFRTTFVATNLAELGDLTLEVLYDDGFKVWINGELHPTCLLSVNMDTGEVPFDGVTLSVREDYTYNAFALPVPSQCLVEGTNVIAIQAANCNLSTSSDFFLDARLTATRGQGGATRGPTPGALNSAYTTNLPPAIRQVEHHPKQPGSGVPVRVTAKVTDPDGVRSVTLEYQLVDPGNYIELTDPAYTNNWTAVAMNDAGTGGDEFAGDSVYTAELPASLQTHRRLVRYRVTAVDGGGRSVTVPYADDPQPNFAYFVYDGAPAWQAAVHPGVTARLNFDTNAMRHLPAIHLLAKRSAVEDATWLSRYGGDAYLWAGTLVFDGEVYDHVHYRARGGVWRYAMVKNMWKFDFNRGHDLQMEDDYGHKRGTRMTKLNLGASIQQGDYLHRGEQGMFESVGFRLFNLAGLEAPETTFVQLRVIDDALEADPADQYTGDFWGVYLVVEQEDGRFLDEHDLPDSNFYKMEGGSGTLNNLGPYGPTDRSDLGAFLSYTSTTPSDPWWQANLDLARYYSYRTIVEGIHHYDIDQGAGKNYFYLTNSLTTHWSVHSWDLDLTWANNMYGGGDEPFRSRVLPRAAFHVDYQNRIREIRDLLFNTNQAWQLIDEHASLLRGTNSGPNILDADRCVWDWNPKMTNGTYSASLSKAGQGRFYQWTQEPTVTRDFNGCIQLMKNYVVTRGTVLDNLARDASIAAQPTVNYTGPTNFPGNRLTFECSPYVGSNGFAALKWRIAEVSDSNAPAYDSVSPKQYEIRAAWESPESAVFDPGVQIPPGVTKVGHAYRVRVRMKDVTGRWSNWSLPVQFVATEPNTAAALVDHLRITEMMYDPPAGSDFEFIELLNTSTNEVLTLDGARFTAGLDFTFPSNATMNPGDYLVLTRTTNLNAFRAQYGLAPDVALIGGYSGSLANAGEQVTLKTGGAGADIVSFQYGGRGWPVAADGAGHSLVPLDRALDGQATGALDYPGNWRPSAFIGGSPGRADPPAVVEEIALNEIVAHTDYLSALDSNDWIELYNRGTSDRALGPDWYLSDDPTRLKKWLIPPATVIPALGWITFDEVSGFHYPTNTGFGLNKSGDQVVLSYLPGTGADRVVDAVRFKGQENDFSLERYPDGDAFWYASGRSSNTLNVLPTPSVVISQIMYHPTSLDGTNDNTLDEYIEILNPTAAATNLFNTNGAWRVDGGVSFTLPANTTLSAGGRLVIVNFDPALGTNLAHFCSTYGLTPGAVPILGPYAGKLGNRSDRIAVEKPQFPDWPGDPYSWVIVDEVIYGNQNPWPASASGGSQALHRTSTAGSGNDPANWYAADPSPGAASANPDRDGDGLPNTWEIAHGLNPDNPNDAALDGDGDGLNNLQEFLAGTDPADPTSVLRFESVTRSGTSTTLTFRTTPNTSYRIEFRDDLSTDAWKKLRDVAADTVPRLMEIEDLVPVDVTERYYRLVVPPTP